MLGLRQLGVVAHGRFTRRGFARAIEVAARGVQEDVIARTRTALDEAGALRPPRAGGGESSMPAPRPSLRLRCRTNESRADLLADPGPPGRRARDGSGADRPSTRFREDLEADSLDLYTLVQELEDSYGVKISDEEAAKILTVDQAVEFVLASDQAGMSRSGRRAKVQTLSELRHKAREAAGRAPDDLRGPGVHALVVDDPSLGLLRAARVPR